MHIPSYKILNVLKVYSEQLTQSKISVGNDSPEQKPAIKGINKSSEGKRQAIIKKVADEIIDRITRSGIDEEIDNEIKEQLKEDNSQEFIDELVFQINRKYKALYGRQKP